jgi:hypothetical protein
MDLIERNKKNSFRHPWEISRAERILKIIKNNSNNFTYADIGSGDLYFSTLLSQVTKSKVYAIDINYGHQLEQDIIINCLQNIENIIISNDIISFQKARLIRFYLWMFWSILRTKTYFFLKF